MKLKDFVRGLVLDDRITIKFRWFEKTNETVYSEVEYTSHRWSVFDTDDMFTDDMLDELILLWGDYIVENWYIDIDENKIVIDMYKEG